MYSTNIMGIPLVIIAGPTGVGKTRVAIEIAERIGGEIIGADSMQIYRYLNIGTAKPSVEERAKVPHHLIDFRNPDEEYSAAEYARDAAALIKDIHARGRLPLLVGGTGLYIRAVLQGIFEGPGRDETFRAEMRTLAEEQGKEALYHKLQQVDPVTAERLHPNDLVRIIRALEVFHLTGVPISTHQQEATVPANQYQTCFLVLTMSRERMYARVNVRVDQMIAAGLVQEVHDLLERGYSRELNSMKSLGYKEIAAYLSGEYDLAAAVELMKRNTRHYAKRQITWFRKGRVNVWISFDKQGSFEEVVKTCVQRIRGTLFSGAQAPGSKLKQAEAS